MIIPKAIKAINPDAEFSITDNNLDNEPNCPNPEIETSMIDECGDCAASRPSRATGKSETQ